MGCFLKVALVEDAATDKLVVGGEGTEGEVEGRTCRMEFVFENSEGDGELFLWGCAEGFGVVGDAL